MTKFRNAFFLLMLALLCCKKPFNPKITSSTDSYLVVEGVIDPGNDSTVFKISKTVKLNNSGTLNPVLGATVTVEGEKNGVYSLYDYYNNGHYNSGYGLNLAADQRYRLRIKTYR